MSSQPSSTLKELLHSYFGDLELAILAVELELIRRGFSNINRIRFEHKFDDKSNTSVIGIDDVWSF